MIRARVLIFDLEEALLDRRAAWQYSVEESVAVVCGERVSARELVDEYRLRPWGHALSILVADSRERALCEVKCAAMYERSAMKRLLVHEGIAMALDAVRAHRVEMAAISREPHSLALKQIESTGLDRFLAVLSPTPVGSAWSVTERIAECLTFLGRAPGEAAFVGADERDLAAASAAGLRVAGAGYGNCKDGDFRAMRSPAELVGLLAGP